MTGTHLAPSITVIEDVGPPLFHLRTSAASLLLGVGPHGHLEVRWFGAPLPPTLREWTSPTIRGGPDVPGLVLSYGGTAQSRYSLGEAPLAWSCWGKGDYRPPALAVEGVAVLDFTYHAHRVVPGLLDCPDVPTLGAESGSETIEFVLRDEIAGLECRLVWTTFPDAGVFTCRSVVRNLGAAPVTVTAVASLLLDLTADAADAVDVLTFDGGWLREAQACRAPLGTRTMSNESTTGSSSTEHNPGVVVLGRETTEATGWCYGVNLVYSGSHATTVTPSAVGTVRVVAGIHPQHLRWELAPDAEFFAPTAVLAFSGDGLNGMSRSMHAFVNRCLVPERWREVARPVVFNSWEASYYDISAESVLRSAKLAAALGAEVYVVDDGWFGGRRDDRAGLGDWWVNEERLPGGLAPLAEQLSALGLKLGLWFEPEAVSPDSDLFRAHPDWAIRCPGRAPSEGRFELLLDLTRAEVRDHVVAAVGAVLDSADIAFVKWDMNRLLADAPDVGFQHRYILGLYDVLRRIFTPRPHILLETCSSGGNRFDLGMLTFGPMIWASDCTDPVQRLSIQRGLSYLYPRSTMSSHVTSSPNHQTRMASPLSLRFGVAATGVLGIQLDPAELTPAEVEALAADIAWYKDHRELLQFGEHWRSAKVAGHEQVTIGDADQMVVARFSGLVNPRSAAPALHAAAAGAAGTDHYEVREQLVDDGLAVRLPGAALRQGVRWEGRARSLSADLFEVRRG